MLLVYEILLLDGDDESNTKIAQQTLSGGLEHDAFEDGGTSLKRSRDGRF
jgi:hypothetical protein